MLHTDPTSSLRLPLIKSRSIVMPDSNVILHFIFEEEEFKLKIKYFLDEITKVGLPCEVLPQVNLEITGRLMAASQEYVKTVRRCRYWVKKNIKKALGSVKVEKRILEIIEKAFMNLYAEIESRYYPRVKQKFEAIRRARVVETSVILEFLNILEESKEFNLYDFFEMLENKFGEKFVEFCDKQSVLMKNINATYIKKTDLLSTTDKLQDVFTKKCGVRNRKDVTLLCQSLSRMYQKNKWCSVVTTDYGDLIKNRFAIDRHTLLIISDPVYFLYHLDKKLDIALNSRDGATKTNIKYTTFINFPKPVGVI